MAKNKRKKIFLYLFLYFLFPAFFLFNVFYIIFNENGLIEYVKLEKDINSLNDQIEKLKEENINLKNEIDSLKKEIPAKIEQIAREKYDMVREGEKTIEFKKEDKDEQKD
jgi:cell division protein FtsB